MNRIRNLFDLTTDSGRDRWLAAVVVEYVWLTDKVLVLDEAKKAEVMCVSGLPEDVVRKLVPNVLQ